MIIITLNVLETTCPYGATRTFIFPSDEHQSSYDIDEVTEDITEYIDFLGDI